MGLFNRKPKERKKEDTFNRKPKKEKRYGVTEKGRRESEKLMASLSVEGRVIAYLSETADNCATIYEISEALNIPVDKLKPVMAKLNKDQLAQLSEERGF